ncbi:MAG: heterocyst frequency control protein PatD [Nostoc sp. SerVER01]|uniref:heterocyst frequency control protein PatD n=1 Tax=Nostoc sp. CCY 9925 TaxID=3103865 RepID=UPI002ADAA1D7|nr:heterocyst frequency control protein PatD [Nostoc sp. SerVER01]MDZ8080060.1 heterocyst frequency control protein PatD [Nostoc sp. DcaGUA01]MDZ8238577.1 heterocyst frequency control protein PatD [Nostoc sp. ChiQUE01a]
MSLNDEKYQAFVTLLEQLRSDATTTQIVAPELRRRVASLQQIFGEEIVPLADQDWRVQSYQTEMSKQLRLLEIDVMFFQGARQASTVQTRLQAISDRLTTLIQYCDAILQPEAEGEK